MKLTETETDKKDIHNEKQTHNNNLTANVQFEKTSSHFFNCITRV